MAEDALEGRITVGKSHHGSVAGEINLSLIGRRVYELQKFLEQEIEKGGDYFRVRWLVLTEEEIKTAVAKAQEESENKAN